MPTLEFDPATNGLLVLTVDSPINLAVTMPPGGDVGLIYKGDKGDKGDPGEPGEDGLDGDDGIGADPVEMAGIHTSIDTLNGQYVTLAGNMDNLFGRVNDHDTVLDDHADDIQDLDDRLDLLEPRVTAAEGVNDTQNTRLTILEGRGTNKNIASLTEPAGPHTIGDMWVDRSVVLS